MKVKSAQKHIKASAEAERVYEGPDGRVTV